MLNRPDSPPPMQFDLFEHCRDVMLRNDVLHALERRDLPASERALELFAQEYPQDPTLPMLALLFGALRDDVPTPFADADGLRSARLVLTDRIGPAALHLYGDAAGAAWLMPLWRRLAQRAGLLAFVADRSDDHAAPLWLRAGDAPAAAAVVATIASWRDAPTPLAWMAEARWRIGGLDAAWPLFAELAWLAPERFDALTSRLPDPPLAGLRKRFDAEFEGEGDVADLAWFPAWALTQAGSLARVLGDAQASPQSAPAKATRLLLELLSLEQQALHRPMVERRRALRDLHPALYAAYMQTRGARSR